ncbi:MAG: hypothetical protein C4321_08575, partial [Chloroflexota bacterium]
HEAWPPLPPHLVPFSPDGWGNHSCFDTPRPNNSEYPVVLWSHERGPDQIPETTHPTFADWLGDAVAQEVTRQ